MNFTSLSLTNWEANPARKRIHVEGEKVVTKISRDRETVGMNSYSTLSVHPYKMEVTPRRPRSIYLVMGQRLHIISFGGPARLYSGLGSLLSLVVCCCCCCAAPLPCSRWLLTAPRSLPPFNLILSLPLATQPVPLPPTSYICKLKWKRWENLYFWGFCDCRFLDQLAIVAMNGSGELATLAGLPTGWILLP